VKRIQGRRRREERSKDLLYTHYLLSIVSDIENTCPVEVINTGACRKIYDEL
jgi:hypothetical protein